MKNWKSCAAAMAAVMASVIAAGCASMGGAGGWETLIDGGRGLDNFENVGMPAGTANWRAEADAIVADRRPSNEGNYFIATKKPYKDFDLRAEFWVSEDANSGIYVRCSSARPITDRTCHEANIFDKRPDPSFATGAIVWLAKAPSPVPLTGGRWNTMEVSARGKHMVVKLNGVVTAESHEAREAGGIIGLQYAGGVVKFRKLQIRPL